MPMCYWMDYTMMSQNKARPIKFHNTSADEFESGLSHSEAACTHVDLYIN